MAEDSLGETSSTKWPIEMEVFCVTRYIEDKSYKQVIEDFRTQFPDHPTPYKSLIYKWVSKFQATGNLEKLHRKTPGCQTYTGMKSIRDEAYLTRIQESVDESPNKSSRRRFQELGIK